MKNLNSLYGAIGGDIIGSAFEYNNIKTTAFNLFSKTSEITDDTLMTIATAEAILNGGDYKDYYLKWGHLYPKADYGESFNEWLKSSNPTPFNSWGNGSAMRVSPVGFAFDTESKVLSEAKKSAECTHNHPEGIKGAQATALAIFYARNGKSKNFIKSEIELWFGYNLSFKLAEIRPDYEYDVSCQGTVPPALVAFLESKDYESAIRNAVSIGGDSDTIAAVTGPIALAFYKEMSEEIVLNIEKRLPEPVKKVCKNWGNSKSFL